MRSKPPDPRLNEIQNAVCAGSSATAARFVAQPFSVCKIYAEVGCPGGKMGPSRTLFWLIRKEGVKSLFLRGSLVAGARAFPHYAIMFTAYDRLAHQWVPKGRPHPFARPTQDQMISVCLSGAAAGTLATLITHPMDVVKVRLVAQPLGVENHYYKNEIDAFKTILAKDGIYRGIYRGLAPSLVGAATFGGSLFALMHFTENLPWRKRGKAFLYLAWLFWPCFSVAGATVITHPLDVLRRKLMAQSFVLAKDGNVDFKFRGLLQLLPQMFKDNTINSFYHGLLPNLMKVVPQVVTFTLLYNGLQTGFLTLAPSNSSLVS